MEHTQEAQGNLVHAGKKILLAETMITKDDGRLVARGKATFMVLGAATMETGIRRGDSASILCTGR